MQYLSIDVTIVKGTGDKMKKNIERFIWPVITKDEVDSVNKQLYTTISIYNRSGIFEEFEDRFRNYHDSRHCVLFNSGTSSLFSMFYAAGIEKGDEVIIPSMTFYATATPLFSLGAIPVIADCEGNGNISPKAIEEAITGKTKAIIVTHLWGVPCDMDRIVKIAKKHDIILLEDCSHAHGAALNNKLVGTFGIAAAFSLQGQKTVTGGEGGCVITDDDEIFYNLLLHGHYNKRCKTEISKDFNRYKYAITGAGQKFRAHPLAIAIANEQMKKLEQILAGRNKFAKRLNNNLKIINSIILPTIDENIRYSWYAYVIKVKDNAGFSAQELCDTLNKNGMPDADTPGSTQPLEDLEIFKDPSGLFKEYESLPLPRYLQDNYSKKYYKSIVKFPIWFQEDKLDLADDVSEIIKQSIKELANGHK